jgi:hypothetical protein
MQRPTPLLPTVTTPIDLWPYKIWAKGNLEEGGGNKKNYEENETETGEEKLKKNWGKTKRKGDPEQGSGTKGKRKGVDVR